jgi:hypothetical protein
MSYKGITKYHIFGDTKKKEVVSSEKKCKFSKDITYIPPKDDINQEIDLIEKKVTIVEYMNDKIEDSDVAIEKLKKDLEKNLTEFT